MASTEGRSRRRGSPLAACVLLLLCLSFQLCDALVHTVTETSTGASLQAVTSSTVGRTAFAGTPLTWATALSTDDTTYMETAANLPKGEETFIVYVDGFGINFDPYPSATVNLITLRATVGSSVGEDNDFNFYIRTTTPTINSITHVPLRTTGMRLKTYSATPTAWGLTGYEWRNLISTLFLSCRPSPFFGLTLTAFPAPPSSVGKLRVCICGQR
jgi:hypothetical protein